MLHYLHLLKNPIRFPLTTAIGSDLRTIGVSYWHQLKQVKYGRIMRSHGLYETQITFPNIRKDNKP